MSRIRAMCAFNGDIAGMVMGDVVKFFLTHG